MKRLVPFLTLLSLTGLVGAWVRTEPWGGLFPVSTAKPDYLITTTDPVFQTDITRITADTNQPINWADPNVAAGVWARKARHHYSKDQPWNSDGTILAMDGYEPHSHYYLDGSTYAPLYPKCGTYSNGDDRWSPDPNFPHIRVNANGTILEWYDMVACVRTQSWSLPLTADGIGAGEGNISQDGRYIALNDGHQILVVDMNPYEPTASVVGPVADISACGLIDPNGNADCVPDWVSVSPSGSHVVVSVRDFLRVYDIDPNLTLTPHVYGPATSECYWHDTAHTEPTGSDPNTGTIFGLGHADMALNPYDGNGDVIIGQRRPWCPNPPSGSGAKHGTVQMVRLADGTVTALTSPLTAEASEASSHHISTRNLDRPGWAYVSYYPVLDSNGLASEPDPNMWRRYQDEIVAIKLDGSGQMERLAHMHSLTSDCYLCEEHAVPSRDGLRVMWASNWLLDCLSCDPNDPGQKADVKAYIVNTTALRTVSAAIIGVPGDQATLQAAVAAASSGDTILLAPGTYTGGVYINGKALTIASWYSTSGDESYIGQTVITGILANYCGGDSVCRGDSIIEFGTEADGGAVIGLSITNGIKGVRSASFVDISHSRITAVQDGANYTSGSGGIFDSTDFSGNRDDGIDLNSNVQVRVINSTIRNNHDDGVEFRLYPYTGTVAHLEFIGNQITGNGEDGIQFIDYDGLSNRILHVERNLFSGNVMAAVGCMAGGNTVEDFSGAPMEEQVLLFNNTFSGNGYGFVGGASVVALNNIFANTQQSALRRVGGNSTAAYNLFWNNLLDFEASNVAAPNVFQDPLLDASFGLTPGSPAIDAGTAVFQWQNTTVLDLPPSAYVGSAPDCGAFEAAGTTTGNLAPTVSAGPDQTVMLPSLVSLDGTVDDDGLPTPPGAVMTTWSKLSGPGDVAFGDASAVDTTAAFTLSGIYVLSLTADDGELRRSGSLTVTVNDPVGTGVSADIRVASSSDDAEEKATGSVSVTSSDLELVYDGANQIVGVHFSNLPVARGESILRAWLQFKVDEVQSETTSLTLQGEAIDNAPAFTTAGRNVSARARTTAAVAWSPAAWTTIGAASTEQRTPDIRSILQEIVNRPGWVRGNSVAFIITGTGHRTAEAYDGDPGGAPVLHLESGRASTNQAPVVDAGPDQTLQLPGTATLDATVSDDGLPNPPAALITLWTLQSGPGTVTFTGPGAVDTVASFSAAGTYVLKLEASDGALTTSDTVSIVVQDPGPTLMKLDVRVAAGSDDAEERPTGSMSLTSSDLELVFDSSIQKVGMRFNGIVIPRGAVIRGAYMQFTVDELQSEATTLTLQAEASDNASVFTTSTGNIAARPRTSAAVTWSPPPWTVIGAAGQNERTVDISPLIREVVSRPGWVSGNSLAIIITGSGHRTAEAFEGGAAKAPLLHVEYE